MGLDLWRRGTPLALGILVLGASGCGTLASLDSASQQLDTYELHSVETAGASPGRGEGPTLYVSEPVTSGAIASDRIVIKPDPYRVAFLPDGRWVDPAPVHVQQLITRSISQIGGFALVSASTSGPLPDYSLLTFLEAFQAEIAGEGAPAPVRVVVELEAALARESDGRIVARRQFTAETYAQEDQAKALVPAFDVASRSVLRELVSWLSAVSPGSV
jgi:cholesterol transport system auxiliary component